LPAPRARGAVSLLLPLPALRERAGVRAHTPTPRPNRAAAPPPLPAPRERGAVSLLLPLPAPRERAGVRALATGKCAMRATPTPRPLSVTPPPASTSPAGSSPP